MKQRKSLSPLAAMLATGLAVAILVSCSNDDKYKKLVVVGDSLSEGVQTGVAFYLTQPNSYAVRVAYKVLKDADDKFELPFLTLPIAADPIGGRRRVNPELETRNLGV